MGNSALTVSTEWLKEQLDEKKKDLVVLDVTYYKDQNAHEEYVKAHIPGAIYFDIMHKVEKNKYLTNNIPDKETFQEYGQSLGIGKDSHVVVYDNEGKGGFYLGARAWWMFRLFGHDKVSVLDGGLQKWTADGNSTSDEVPEIKEKGDFKVDMEEEDWLVSYEEMVGNLVEDDSPQVVDGRPPAMFDGNKTDKKTGHYPGAKNVPYMNLLKDGTCLKSEDELKDIFKKADVDLSEKVIAMGAAGMGICTLVLAAKLCGAKSVKLYLGGANEWFKRAEECQIEQTPDEPAEEDKNKKPAEEDKNKKPAEEDKNKKPAEDKNEKPAEEDKSEKPAEGDTQKPAEEKKAEEATEQAKE